METVDFGSLLLASALSGVCLALTLGSIWISSRSDYVLTMAGGIALLVAHIVAFWLYGQKPSPWLCQVTLALLVAGFYVVSYSARQYLDIRRDGISAITAGVSIAIALMSVAFGLDGVGFIVAYGAVCVLLAKIAAAFWRHGNLDHKVLVLVSLLSGSSAISFALCAGVLLWNGQWQLGTTPDNWAEQVNTVLAVICMTGLGALTMSMHNLRTRDALVADTMTDPLTGLMNRRGLDSIHGNRVFGAFSAIAMFDLDHFKRTNDVFGHPIGDQVLKRFSTVLSKHAGQNVDVFRLGGEEFCAVISRVEPARAKELAGRIGTIFGAEVVPTPNGPLRSTVSAGVACGSKAGLPLDALIANADAALYEAKRAGRNCVILAGERPPASRGLIRSA